MRSISPTVCFLSSVLLGRRLALVIILDCTEMYSYLRSPFRDLYVYDKMVQVRILSVLYFGHVTYTILWLPYSPDPSE